MKVREMRDEAARLCAAGLQWMTVVVPRECHGRRTKVLPAWIDRGQRAVFGEVVAINHEGHSIVKVDAERVVLYFNALEASGVHVEKPLKLRHVVAWPMAVNTYVFSTPLVEEFFKPRP